MLNKPLKSSFVMEDDTYNALHLFAIKRVGADAADDLVQEAYLRFLQLEDPHNIREPRAFLFRIIANLGIDFWRKEKVRGTWKAEQDNIDFDDLESSHPGPEARVNEALQMEALLAALKEVPETHRHAFVLNKFEGLTQAAIAKQFGIPEKVIQRQIAGVVAHCAKRLNYE
jgi:RNA polymerase sigma factor (sigma-70 family)